MYGYQIITAMLKQDGYNLNRKRMYHIWRHADLQLPRRKVTKRLAGTPLPTYNVLVASTSC